MDLHSYFLYYLVSLVWMNPMSFCCMHCFVHFSNENRRYVPLLIDSVTCNNCVSNDIIVYIHHAFPFEYILQIPVKNEIDTIDEVRGVIAIASAVLVTLALCPITI